MKTVRVEDAVGMVLGHDVTEILPGRHKGPAFRKGHVIRAEDIPRMLDIGKRHIFVLKMEPGMIHENDAALRMAAAAAGDGIELTSPAEGKVNLKATGKGLLKVRADALARINAVPAIAFATRHTNQTVAAGEPVAGTRIIPLVIEEARVREVEAICAEDGPVVSVKPFRPMRVGIVTTGSEVFHGRIKDRFGPVLRDKFAALGAPVLGQRFVSDEIDMTVGAIRGFLKEGAEFIAVTGGMSVDPDDQTPAAIRAAGGVVEAYGAPVFPGAMFLLAAIDGVPVVGLPGCVMYFKASIFDLVVPRIMAGETVERADITAMGHGGFCAGCADCRFPICPFGKI